MAEQLGLLPFPPSCARERVRVATDPSCWLCGGATGGAGWDRRDAFPPTFTNVTLAAQPHSHTVCEACAAVSRGESWAHYAARRPELGLATKHPISWRSYAHAVWVRHHECPTAKRWRALLLEPPAPPFLYLIPTSKQKHLAFRARLAHDRDHYPVQYEETTIWIDRQAFAACLAAIEALLAAGARRGEVERGQYHQETLRRIGLVTWQRLERALQPWRLTAPDYVAIGCLVANGPAKGE